MTQFVLALTAIGVAVIVFLVCRELMCWYWKVNEGLALLARIEGHLAAMRPRAPAIAVAPAPAQAAAPGEHPRVG
jgi:hypothetical protein